MRSILYLILVTTALLFSCSSDSDKHVAVGLTKTMQFAFSDSLKKDTFKIETVGKNASDMLLVFTITNADNRKIYEQNIRAIDLLKGYLASAELKKEADKEKFIKDEVEYFFNEEHFLEPAVTANEQPDKNTPDTDFYKELKNNGLNGFMFRTAKDKNYYIAWSAKDQKVKIYYSCCQG